MSSRFLIVAPVALVITVALFFMMRYLIAPSPEKPEVVAEAPKLEIGRKIDDTRPEPTPLQRPTDKEPPKPQKPNHDDVRKNMSRDGIEYGEPTGLDRVDVGPLVANGSASPIIRPKPEYPSCGTGTGEVLLEYVVEPDGSVGDVQVLSATSSCFASAAKRATTRWRYRPKVVEGQAVRSERLRVKLVFEPE